MFAGNPIFDYVLESYNFRSDWLFIGTIIV